MRIRFDEKREEQYLPIAAFLPGTVVESRNGNRYLLVEQKVTACSVGSTGMLSLKEPFIFYPDGGKSASYKRVPVKSLTLELED